MTGAAESAVHAIANATLSRGKMTSNRTLYNGAIFLSIFMLAVYLPPPRGGEVDSEEKVIAIWEEFQKVAKELGPSLPAMLNFRWNDGSMWQSAWVDERLVRKLHFGIVPVVSWLVLAPLQMTQSIRSQYPRLHRRCGYVFFLISSGISTGVMILISKGKVMGHPHWAAVVLNVIKVSYFVLSMIMAIRHARRRELSLHQEWVLRHVAMGYSVSFQRVLLIVIGPVLHAAGIIRDLDRTELQTYYNITTLLSLLVPLVVEYHISKRKSFGRQNKIE